AATKEAISRANCQCNAGAGLKGSATRTASEPQPPENSAPSGLRQHPSLAPQALGAVAQFALQGRLGRYELVLELTLVAQRKRNQILREKFSQQIVPPRCIDRLDHCPRLITVKHQGDFPISVKHKALGSRRGPDFLAVDDDGRSRRIRADGV